MVGYVLWALLLYLLYVIAHGGLRLLSCRDQGNIVAVGLGSRDAVDAKSVGAQRAGRAQRNMEESLFFFLPLALLLIVTDTADGIGATGALVFLMARAAYLPTYIAGVFALRSILWLIGGAGLVMMAARLAV